MKDYNLNDLLNNIDFKSNRLVKINNKLYLTNYQIEILNKYNIDYKSLGNLSSRWNNKRTFRTKLLWKYK